MSFPPPYGGCFVPVSDYTQLPTANGIYQREISKLRDQLGEKESRVVELERKISELRRIVAEQQSTISQYETCHCVLAQEIFDLRRKNETPREKDQAYKDMEDDNDLLSKRNTALLEEVIIQKLESQAFINALQNEIAQLKGRIIQLELASIDRNAFGFSPPA